MTTDIRRELVVVPGKSAHLDRIDPRDASLVGDKEEARERLAADVEAIADLQERLYAERSRALLVILQGMDTAGKDSTIRAVFNTTGPSGVIVTPFGRPSPEELAHDFLWRVHKVCPPRGTIGVFNRSHYEDVLAGRVRKLVSKDVIKHRYDQINQFESLISSSTHILKIMLHISKDEQRERLQARLDDPEKHWKFDPGDLEDRKLWDEYMEAYETVLTDCSTEAARWYVVPSDRKWARNAMVAALVRVTLEDMDPRYPKVDWKASDFEVR